MLRTGKKYIDDVKGRATVFIGGERGDDITTHRAWRPEPVALARFLGELETLASPSLPAGVGLHIDARAEGDFLLDPGMLLDATLNLVLNAATIGRGGEEVTTGDAVRSEHWYSPSWTRLSLGCRRQTSRVSEGRATDRRAMERRRR